ncbi:MAG: ribonuclease P protein component [Candidatus Latescibacteria bacterium]|nr:ribonuclease P protein component [Candidatus Latescibacterota bacterium]
MKGQNLWVRVGRADDQDTIFVIRRALGTAVDRNRLKRRLRSIFREIGKAPVPVVVLPLPSSVFLQYRSLRDELGALLSRLNDGSG